MIQKDCTRKKHEKLIKAFYKSESVNGIRMFNNQNDGYLISYTFWETDTYKGKP